MKIGGTIKIQAILSGCVYFGLVFALAYGLQTESVAMTFGVWFSAGFLAYVIMRGFWSSYFKSDFRLDIWPSILCGLIGPAGLVMSLFYSFLEGDGLRLRLY